VTAYLLIAFSFGAIYHLISQLNPHSPQLPDWIELGSLETICTEMIDFSLVTLATLGYGDILPSLHFTQMLAVLEAVINQFFMAVSASRLVGMFV
jgi:voltage-gated potassium channel